jgi:hypothetical protein
MERFSDTLVLQIWAFRYFWPYGRCAPGSRRPAPRPRRMGPDGRSHPAGATSLPCGRQGGLAANRRPSAKTYRRRHRGSQGFNSCPAFRRHGAPAFGLTQIQSSPSGSSSVPFVSIAMSKRRACTASISEASSCRSGSPPVKTTNRRSVPASHVRSIASASDARQSQHRRDSNRIPPRRLAGDAVSIYARRADREYPRRLRTAALSQRGDAPGRLQPGGGRRQCADSGRCLAPRGARRPPRSSGDLVSAASTGGQSMVRTMRKRAFPAIIFA